MKKVNSIYIHIQLVGHFITTDTNIAPLITKVYIVYPLFPIAFLAIGTPIKITDTQNRVKVQVRGAVPVSETKTQDYPLQYQHGNYDHLHINRLSIRAGNVHRTIMDVGNLDYPRGGSNRRALLLHTVFSSDQQHGQGHAQQNFYEHFE